LASVLINFKLDNGSAGPPQVLNIREQLGDVLRQRVWHGETRCIVSG
jgi:hypothetical protein